LRIDRHGAEADRLTALIESAPPGMSTADQGFERDGFRRRQVSAQEECEAAVTLARRIALALEHDGEQAAARIRSLGDAPYHQPGVLSRLVGGVADWVSTHADGLRAVSNVLKAVSAVAGLLSFIPVLTPIFAPIAGITAVGALAIDAALIATGHGDWKSLAVDAALMAVPAAGRLASRAIAVRGADALPSVRASHGLQLGHSGAVIDEGKLDYLFGGVESSAHNAARSAQNLEQMRRLGVSDTPFGRALVQEHLQRVARDGASIVTEFSNQYGRFQVRESLFAGPSGAFAKLQSTWQVLEDGSLRLTTVIPFGGG
jgi:hypothetical protein